MKYEDLRKGNLIYFPFIGKEVEVIGINALWGNPYFNKLSLKDGIDLYYESIDVFKPILLTEEWINKFEHVRESKFYDGKHNKGFYLGENELLTVVSFEDGIYLYTMEDGEEWGCVGNKIEFVHELQNIFYWNDNQKLELTLKQ